MSTGPLLLPSLPAADAELRRAAFDAASRVATQESLPLNRAAIGRLADAILDGLRQPLLVSGFSLACDRVEQYISDTDRYLIAPARRRDEAGQDTAGTLDAHLQYLEGMRDLHARVLQALQQLRLGASLADSTWGVQPGQLTSPCAPPPPRETT